jgi:hypothetical protein
VFTLTVEAVCPASKRVSLDRHLGKVAQSWCLSIFGGVEGINTIDSLRTCKTLVLLRVIEMLGGGGSGPCLVLVWPQRHPPPQ